MAIDYMRCPKCKEWSMICKPSKKSGGPSKKSDRNFNENEPMQNNFNDQAVDRSDDEQSLATPVLIDGDYSRENLIAICEAAVVNVKKWFNRDSPSAHEKLGLAWVMLKAGCEFHVHPPRPGESGCFTDDHTIWLTISWPTFSTFEYGGGHEESDTFYLPTPKRLREREGRDWY